MNPILLATLRRHWRIIGSIAAFLVFTVIHLGFYRPAAARYRAALASVGGLEAVFNPGGNHPMLPPRVYARVTENSLSAQDAMDRGGSGALGVVLLEELGRVASRSGVRISASEPGPVTQEALTTQVRVHVTLTGRYAELIRFFSELSADPSLLIVERMSLRATPGTDDVLDLWLARLYLKQPPVQP